MPTLPIDPRRDELNAKVATALLAVLGPNVHANEPGLDGLIKGWVPQASQLIEELRFEEVTIEL